MKNSRTLALAFILIPLFSISQSRNISSYSENANMAVMFAMRSPYDTIIFDKGASPWILGPMNIKNVRNKVVILEEGVEIKAKPGAFPKTGHALFQFIECTDITILGNGGLIRMNKEEYTDGEWRHGISLRGCKNFTIRDLTVRDTGGDGVYLDGWGKDIPYSENITIKGVHSINNKRQGLSIISAKTVLISDCLFAETKGTNPAAGLDIEPDHPDNQIVDIRINHCTFRDNYGTGIKLALAQLNSDSNPISVLVENCVITNNHSEDNPKSAAELLIHSNSYSPVKGEVVFRKCVIENSKWGVFYSRKRADSFSVTFIDCSAKNICSAGTWPPFFLEVPDYYKKTGEVGGFFFKNFYLSYKTEVPLLVVQGSRIGTLEGLKDIGGDITISGNDNEFFRFVNYDPKLNNNVNLDITRKY
ncbi:MAG TPA: right-handed parallel beta-helix repeat-containing protein [Eudoraea sp.]|nr:right-handed parallel beta-helix repeat-containing protein [Eudoraea sp.]